MKNLTVLAAFALAFASPPAAAQDAARMTFFLVSAGPGDGANLGGLAGADKHCQSLASAAGSKRSWRAYLSTSGQGGVNARDRIGKGPWHNIKGDKIADNVADLHSDKNNLTKQTQLTEKGVTVPGVGDQGITHDILTGSQLDGTAFTDGSDKTCKNWTSSGEGAAQVGHHDRQGGGANPTSWNSAHATPGCGAENLRKVGGAGQFYCFAVD
jgi:hypothetical protein